MHTANPAIKIKAIKINLNLFLKRLSWHKNMRSKTIVNKITQKRMIEVYNEFNSEKMRVSNGKLYIGSRMITTENVKQRITQIIRENGLDYFLDNTEE